MLRLHHAPMACSLASRFALAEAGLAHRDDLVTFFDVMDVEEGRAS